MVMFCVARFALAVDAAATYQVMCNGNVNDTASDGSLMFVGDLPSCKREFFFLGFVNLKYICNLYNREIGYSL